MILKLFFLVIFSFLLVLSKQVQQVLPGRELAHFISKMQSSLHPVNPAKDLFDYGGGICFVLWHGRP